MKKALILTIAMLIGEQIIAQDSLKSKALKPVEKPAEKPAVKKEHKFFKNLGQQLGQAGTSLVVGVAVGAGTAVAYKSEQKLMNK